MDLLRVEEIKQKPREVAFSEPASAFPALHAVEQSGECIFAGPVTGTLRAIWEYDHVRVEGAAIVPVSMACARCLAEFEQEISATFVVYYTEAMPGGEPDDEIELAEQDLLSASYSGDAICVATEIAEQLLMALPIKPLCNERCQGLCAGCGIDLNTHACSCGQPQGSLAFSALQQFTVPSKGD